MKAQGDGSRRAHRRVRDQSLLSRHRSLADILVAEALSSAGDAIFWVGLLVWLLEQPHGTSLIALAAVARLGPRVVLSAAGGVLADRRDRRVLMVALDLLRGALMVALAVLTESGATSAQVLLIVLVVYVLATPYRPALTAGIPLVVGEGDAAAANALDGTVRQIATFLGPLIGTAVLLLGSPAWAFAVNGVTFALSALFIARVHALGGEPPAVRMRNIGGQAAPQVSRLAARPVGAWWDSMVDGLRAVSRQAGLGLLTWLVFVFSIARGFELVLLVLVAQDRLALGAEGVGVLSAAIGVGALLVLPFMGGVSSVQRPATAVVTSLLLTAVPLALLATISSAVVACVALAAVGVGVVVFEVLSITLVQRLSRLDLLGRVFGIQNMAVNAGKLAGCLLAPVLVTELSLEDALVVAAVIVAVSALVAVPGLHRVAHATNAARAALAPVVDVLAHLAVFDGAPDTALERVARGLRTFEVSGGTAVVRQNDVPDHLYVVRAGEFDVVKDGVQVARLGPDDWFGEIGLLRQTPRTATVRAVGPGELWEIPGIEFLAAVNEASLPPAALLDGMTARLAQLEQLTAPEPPIA
jgi:predicted MFS family arabinose efflux permease